MDRHSSFISIWLQLELCAMAVLLTKGEIRCYCDAPHCVATGYMCKSELNHCFTKVLDPHNANSPLTHGCLDPVANAADVCGGGAGASNNKATTDFLVAGVSTLECCHDDMCNYRGLHDLAHTRDSTDHSRYQPGGESGVNSNRNLVTRVHTELASAKEVWFRAAVIAVPIAGGLILVLLIMLALRMLRSENKRLQDQRQQMLSRLHYSFHGSSHHHHSGAGGGGHTFKGKGGHGGGVSAKLDLECMVPVTGHENCCLTCDKMRQADGGHLGLGLTGLGLGGLGGDSKIMSLVHWGMYSGHGKLEFV